MKILSFFNSNFLNWSTLQRSKRHFQPALKTAVFMTRAFYLILSKPAYKISFQITTIDVECDKNITLYCVQILIFYTAHETLSLPHLCSHKLHKLPLNMTLIN